MRTFTVKMSHPCAMIGLLALGVVTMGCGDDAGAPDMETEPSENIALEGLEGFELHGDVLVRKPTDVAEGVGESQEALLAITGSDGRWGPNCRIPYAIDPSIPSPVRILQAIAQIELRTGCRFPQVVDTSISGPRRPT